MNVIKKSYAHTTPADQRTVTTIISTTDTQLIIIALNMQNIPMKKKNEYYNVSTHNEWTKMNGIRGKFNLDLVCGFVHTAHIIIWHASRVSLTFFFRFNFFYSLRSFAEYWLKATPMCVFFSNGNRLCALGMCVWVCSSMLFVTNEQRTENVPSTQQ